MLHLIVFTPPFLPYIALLSKLRLTDGAANGFTMISLLLHPYDKSNMLEPKTTGIVSERVQMAGVPERIRALKLVGRFCVVG